MNEGTWATEPAPLASLGARVDRLKRWGLTVIGGWPFVFGAWALFAPISGGVVAQGLVKVDANRRLVTHRDGGTVARVLVREGERVQAGQVLVELEDVRVEASEDMVRAQFAADRLRLARLQAEATGAKRFRPASEVLSELDGQRDLASLVRKEQASFEARHTNLAAQMEGDRRQAADTRSEISVRLRERDNAGQALALMRDELRQNEQLEREQYVHRAKVLSLRRQVSEYESRQLANEAELAQARQRLAALESHMRALQDNFQQQVADEIREVSSRLSDNEQRLRSTVDDRARQRIVSPIGGRLVNLRVNTAGSAIGPREPIVEVVPDDVPLRIEARLPLDVAADVKPGLASEVRIQTAQSRFDPLLAGRVTQVSADAVQDERSGAAFVMAWVDVDVEQLRARDLSLQPGMAAEVYITIARRTPVGFLIEPVTGFFRRAFREH